MTRRISLLIGSAVLATAVAAVNAGAAGERKPKKPAAVPATAAAKKPEAKAAAKSAAQKAAPARTADATTGKKGDRKIPASIREIFKRKHEAAARGNFGTEGPRVPAGDGRLTFNDWFIGQRAYPAKTIPQGALGRAFSSAQRENAPRRRPDGTLAPNAAAAPSWDPIGPSTIPDGQTDISAGSVLSPVSGRVSAIAAHPTNPNIVYAGGAQGGVWKTANALAASPTWVPLTDHQATLAIGDIAIDPVNPNIIYAGTGEANGSCDSYYGQGMLRSTNGGATWVLLGGTGQPFANGGPFSGKAIAKIVIDPSTAGSSTATTLWATTALAFLSSGTSNCQATTAAPIGVWRSTDSGATWTRQLIPGLGVNDGLREAHDAALDPTNPNTLYVAIGRNGVWKSTDAKAPVPTFTRMGTGYPAATTSPANWRITLGIGGSASPNTLYAAIEDNGSALWGFYRTTDGAATWSNVDGGVNGTGDAAGSTLASTGGAPFTAAYIGRRIIINNTFSRTVATVTNATTLTYSGGSVTATGATWSIAAYPDYCAFQCSYDMTVGVDPADANVVYVGGNPHTFNADLATIGAGGAHSVWRTDDGGSTWRGVSQGDGVKGGLHVDDHDFAFYTGTTPSRVYNGNDGGIWRSDDKGSSWNAMNTNLAITQFQGVSTHPTNPNVVLGGTQDNGTNILNPDLMPAPAWFHTDFGDGGRSAIDQNDPNKMYHTYFNQSFNFYGPARSDTGGDNGPGNWLFVGTYFGYGAQYYNGFDPTDRVSFYAPLEVNSAVNPSAVYFGTHRLYRSTDPRSPLEEVPSWTLVSGTLTRFAGSGFVSAIGPAPFLVAGNEVAYTGSSDGRLSVSANVATGGAGSWVPIDPTNTILPTRFIAEIEVDARDATGNTAYVAVSGFNANTPTRPGHVFKITGGLGVAAVTNISSDLPDVPVSALAVDPTTTPSTLYAGTDIGVFMSRDDGASWIYLNDGHPNVAVFGLERNHTTGQVVSATHGRGMFELASTGLDDTNPPVCAGANVSNSLFQGSATDVAANDSGIATVALSSATNAVLNTTFSGPNAVSFTVSLVNNCAAGSATVVVTDHAGLTCSLPVSLPGDQPATPAPASNSPVDPGDTIELTVATVPGATYSWVGPNGFTSALQNPTIPNATSARNGLYTVTVSVNGCTASGSTYVVVTSDADWNGDGKADLVWRDQGSSGLVAVWTMDGVNKTGAALVTPAPMPALSWEIQGVGDFDNDGDPDLVWRDQGSTGHVAIWLMNGTAKGSSVLVTAAVPVPALTWRIVGTGDFNGDGHTDLVWRDQGGTGSIAIWHMNTTSKDSAVLVNAGGPFPALNWQIQGVGDFNNDGHADLVWRDQGSTGHVAIWLMTANVKTSSVLVTAAVPIPALSWQIQAVGDYNGDGKDDLVWREQMGSGNVAAWYVDGATKTGAALVTPAPMPALTWRIVGPK